MHVLMLSLDISLLTQTTGNARRRHERYAELLGGDLSIVVCNRRGASALAEYQGSHVTARPTASRTYVHYLTDGLRAGMAFHAERRIDVIASQDAFLTGLIGLRLRRATGAPLIVQVHSPTLDNRAFSTERLRNRPLQWLARWLLPRADAVRVVSQAERAACIRHGVAPERACVIPVAPDVARFVTPAPAEKLDAWRRRLNLPPDAPVVLWVGRPVPFKNVPLLLRAFQHVHAAMPDVHLIVAGDVALSQDDLPALADALGVAAVTHFPGPVPHDELPAVYQISALYAHPSLYEGLGLVMVEAGVSGLPVVSTATDGALEVIANGQTGLIVPTHEAQPFAQAMLELLRDPQRARAMGERARAALVERFDEERLMRQWVEMWKHVARKEKPCAS